MARQTRISGLRPFANRFINPITRHFAEWLPGFTIMTYRGRKSGRVYHLPLNIFRRDGAWVCFLTYGSEAQWVQNVLAAGGCEIRKRGRTIRLVDPELIVDPARTLVPRPIRFVGRLGGVTEFLRLHPAPSPSTPT